MAKYNYDKKKLKGLSVFPFINEVKTRNEKIEAAPDTIPNSWFNPNEIAKRLHPAKQHCIIEKIIPHKDANSYVLVPDPKKGTSEMAYFRAGQYVSVDLDIDGSAVSRPYTISSGPKDALGKENTSYTLTIKKANPSFVSDYILKNWKVGDEVTISGPQGEFYYQSLRDAPVVVALAGGSGITPFYSLAQAIDAGIEDLKLILLYGSKTEEDILFKAELEELEKKNPDRIRVIHVLSEEKSPGYEQGFINADVIQKYAPKEDYSLWICGPAAMTAFLNQEIPKLNLKSRRIRKELSGDIRHVETFEGFPAELKDKEFNLTVKIRDTEKTIPAKATESLVTACERAGIRVPNHCRSGECGWCHSRLVDGEVFIPEQADGRRMGDVKFDWIHPCAAFPLSDVILEVFPEAN